MLKQAQALYGMRPKLLDLPDHSLLFSDQFASSVLVSRIYRKGTRLKQTMADYKQSELAAGEYEYSITAALQSTLNEVCNDQVQKHLAPFGYDSIGADRANEHLRGLVGLYA